jgi:predicted CXXCH cytochrome family protein
MMISSAIVPLLITSLMIIPAPADYGDDCTASGCHDDFQKKAVVHDPASSDGCDVCHTPLPGTDHEFKFAEEGAELCVQCHDAFEGKVRHDPVEEGECTVCHDPHASASRFLLTQPSVGDLCLDCHDGVREDLPYVHGPVAGGACTACHDAHASTHRALLLKTGTEQCYSCHTEMKETMASRKHVHAAVEDDCSGCHEPHGGKNPTFVKSSPPALCLDCHSDLEEALAEAAVPHKPVSTEAACGNCHNAHATKYEHLLLAEPAELCFPCHEKAVNDEGSDLPDMRSFLANHPQHHGPVGDSACGDCHAVHGNSNFRFLAEPYPSRFYAPFKEENYALCFSCHDSEMVTEESTDSATEFRNGNQNLHFIHVNRKVKGRTCRACHEPHASSQPSHMRESVPFGSWRIPIGFRQTSNGGFCASGCHKVYRYDRLTAVENIPRTSPNETAKP